MAPTNFQHCTRCLYEGPQNTFPHKVRGIGYVKTCHKCTNMVEAQRRGRQKENANPVQDGANTSGRQKGPTLKPSEPVLMASWSSLLDQIKSFRKQAFDVEAFIPVSDLKCPDEDTEKGSLDGAKLAKHIAAKVWDATEYCFM